MRLKTIIGGATFFLFPIILLGVIYSLYGILGVVGVVVVGYMLISMIDFIAESNL